MPWSRKYSATLVAANAARSRTNGGLSRCRHDDDRAFEAFGPEVVFQEAANLTAALADEGNDRDIGSCALGHHPQQRALAHAAATEDANALAASARQQSVDGSHARAQRRRDRFACQGVDRYRLQRIFRRRTERSEAVQRISETVDHAAEKGIPHCRGCDGAARDEPISGTYAGGPAEGNGEEGAIPESDHFHRQR